jgi:Na+/melibiose symporter-like transporter
VTAANVAMLLLAGTMFPMFFFLSLYMQQVLGYSAIKAGLAFLVIAGGLIVSSGLAQGLVTRVGAKVVLTVGLLGAAVAQVLFVYLPVAGRFTADLLPGYLIVAVALGLAFVGGVIASTIGVKPADSGLASGLVNASQQIGGAVGLAVTTTVAVSRTTTLLHAGHTTAAALTGGFHAAFAVTGAVAVVGALVAVTLIRRPTAPAEPSLPADLAIVDQATSLGDIDVS